MDPIDSPRNPPRRCRRSPTTLRDLPKGTPIALGTPAVLARVGASAIAAARLDSMRGRAGDRSLRLERGANRNRSLAHGYESHEPAVRLDPLTALHADTVVITVRR